jgi:transcriptional regulator with XRE-family HTH domain
MTIREARLARGLTQQELAEAAHISMWLVKKLDHDPERRPRSGAIREAVANALGVTSAELWPPAHPRA